ncbi:hypothetical protein [Bradyrhizobium sp.]|uniref:hypothetical protein n=1 Tax=Bradyrhizobium sp. TaxID=376 RepID=UPI003C5BCDEB
MESLVFLLQPLDLSFIAGVAMLLVEGLPAFRAGRARLYLLVPHHAASSAMRRTSLRFNNWRILITQKTVDAHMCQN